MSLRSPNLDDRNFEQLLSDAKIYAKQFSRWQPVSPSDPGTALLELFAYITDMLLYRVNRIPEKVYVELLRLIGVELIPPSAATTRLQFSRKNDDGKTNDIVIPENTAVSNDAGITFLTLADAIIKSDSADAEVSAIHAQWIDYQSIGQGTGNASMYLTLPQAPLIAPSQGRQDIILAVQPNQDEKPTVRGSVKFNNREYHIWSEVQTFAGCAALDRVYKVDRAMGAIHFAPYLNTEQTFVVDDEIRAERAPKALAAIPSAGRDIIVRYRVGGGEKGNLPTAVLNKIKRGARATSSLSVTNITRATGGAEMESLENALTRGPLELNSLQRVVTAQDFELFSTKKAGVNRAYAYTKKSQWQYAAAGTVEVILVPQVSSDQELITPAVLVENENTDLKKEIHDEMQRRKPLGTMCEVTWCQYKSVGVDVRLTIFPEEDRLRVKSRIQKRLYELISPLNKNNSQTGWRFGQSLLKTDVYRILLDEPGVKSVDSVQLTVAHAPDNNCDYVEVDAWQQDTWYAASTQDLYRTINNGQGWELLKTFPGEMIQGVKSFPRENQFTCNAQGLLALWTRSDSVQPTFSRLYISRDCGESWMGKKTIQSDGKPWKINDVAWIERQGVPALLVATSMGLYESGLENEWEHKLIKSSEQALPARSVAVITSAQGKNRIAVLTTRDEGVFLSANMGDLSSFYSIGLQRQPVEILAVQYGDTQRFLWAGFFASGDDAGEGCKRLELRESDVEHEKDWKTYDQGWKQAGACTCLSFARNNEVYAGTGRYGVLKMTVMGDQPQWRAVDFGNGLQQCTDKGPVTLETIKRIAVWEAESTLHIMSAGMSGVYRSGDGGNSYTRTSQKIFNDKVTLPPTWLFCSAEHKIIVEYN